jgi:hypothetical protein
MSESKLNSSRQLTIDSTSQQAGRQKYCIKLNVSQNSTLGAPRPNQKLDITRAYRVVKLYKRLPAYE